MASFKYQNGNVINYKFKKLDTIESQNLIQSIIVLTEKLYDESIDSVEGSYELDKILDIMIEIED